MEKLNNNFGINKETQEYNQLLDEHEVNICNQLAYIINKYLKNNENKIWHSHPVWFLDGNPIVGYSKEKKGIRLMFWSGADFEEKKLHVRDGKFKDASIFYNSVTEINEADLKLWLEKSEKIQWDYKNLIKRRGKLERIQANN
ncbi:MAG: DUF1801 domain-containing protein [Chitinophagaceae bacterium]|nr:DUF1801 domain-containing protein [Chitinophagaceae bacterium]